MQMTFEKIGKGEALLWLSGAAGVETFGMLLAVIAGLSYVIPELNYNPGRLFYPAMFVFGLVAAYLLYRIGVAGERPRKVVALWFSGVFGDLALGQLIFAIMGWSFEVPQLGVVYSSSAQPLGFALMFIVALILSLALWMHAKNDGKATAPRPAAAKAAARKRRR